MTVIIEQPILSESDIDPDEIRHVVCCRNNDIALCATDVTDSDWHSADTVTTCLVCADLENNNYCPFDGELC